MSIMCTVEQSEIEGELHGLRITHPEMGVIMDWGSTLPTAVVRRVPQQLAFQLMANIERVKTYLMDRDEDDNTDDPPINETVAPHSHTIPGVTQLAG